MTVDSVRMQSGHDPQTADKRRSEGKTLSQLSLLIKVSTESYKAHFSTQDSFNFPLMFS